MSTVRRRWLGLLATGAIVAAGVTLHLAASPYSLTDSAVALQQLDLLYLDEPAPGLDALGVEPGRPAVIVFCPEACPLPAVPGAQVVRSQDAELAARYALVTDEGRVGPGYALVDADGQLRYRTFDPELSRHEREIEILVEGLS